MPEPAEALRQFCDRSGADAAWLGADGRYAVEAAPEGWDGQLGALRVERLGRFGKRFWQLHNAVLVARSLGVRQLWLDADDISGLPSDFGGFLIARTPPERDRPTLAGSFEDISGFGPLLNPPDDQAVSEILARLFPAPAADPPGENVLVMQFRGGAIFPAPGNAAPNHHVMPPAAFYLRAFAHAQAELGVVSALLVHEDRANPAVTAVEVALHMRGVTVQTQTADAAATLLAATHLVTPFGTTSEAIAALSPRLRSLFRFRSIDSYPRPQPRLLPLLQASGVRCFLGQDTGRPFIAPGTWDATLRQRAEILAFPESAITITECAAPSEDASVDAKDFAIATALLAKPNGRSRLAARLAHAFAGDPDVGSLPQWLDAVLDPYRPLPPNPARDPTTTLLWQNLAHLHARAAPRQTIVFGPEYDFLAACCDPYAWPLLLWLTMLAMRQRTPTRRLAAVTMARDEGINLLEWIAHQQAIGIEHIFVYTNDNDDGSDPLLDRLAADGIITLVRHSSAKTVNIQCKAMQHALLFLPELRDFAWVAFLDVDEFIVPAAKYDHDARKLIAAVGDRPCGAIILPWRWRIWPHRFDRAPGLTLDGFPHAVPHFLFKAISYLPATTSMCQIHLPRLDPNIPKLNSALEPMTDDALWANQPKPQDGGWIEHFWAKSFVEFVVKQRRGEHLAIPTGEFRREARLFRDWNFIARPENLAPVPASMIARTRAALAALMAIPDLADAAAAVDARFTEIAAHIAADPAMCESFAALAISNDLSPDLRDHGAALAVLNQPNGQAKLAARLTQAFPDDPDIGMIDALLAAALDPAVPWPPYSPRDRTGTLQWQNIADIRAFRTAIGPPPRTIRDIGPDHDYLVYTCKKSEWPLLLWLNLLAIRQLRPTRKIAAMTTMRDEGINILEWVAHHQAIGVEHLFVYTNDNLDASDMLLEAMAEAGAITLIRNARIDRAAQRKSMQHALLCLPELRDFEWVLFIDADEYAIPAPRYDFNIRTLINAAVAAHPGPLPGTILLPWFARRWPHAFAPSPGPALPRFPHAQPHELFKSITRLASATGLCQLHVPDMDAGIAIVDSAFNPVAPDTLWTDQPKTPHGGRVEHIWTKSFTEFFIKRRRGSNGPTRDINLFVTWNSPSTLDNIDPVPPEILGRTQARIERLLKNPTISAAQSAVETRFAEITAEIAADPELRAIFGAMPDPNA